ncbi:hypothetical protein Tco_1472228, partial [Tanacetum coccineum]
MPLMDKGGSAPKLPYIQQFSTSGEGQMTIKDANAQMEEIKRLVALKLEKEKSEKRLKVLTHEELKAQATELAAYEAKRAKMLEEYNHYINFRADPLPITKISYRVNNSTKKACMRITRNNQPLKLTVYGKFVLKMLAKFQWVKTQARKLGIPPLPQLTAFGLSASKKKRKRSFEIIKEVFVKEDIMVDGIHRNLVPPLGVVEFYLDTTAQLIRVQSTINRDTPEGREMFNKIELAIEAKNDVVEARKIVKDNLDNL